MRKAINAIVTYIVVLCAFAIVDALVLPMDYWQPNIKPDLLKLAFAVFLGTILIYVRKAKKTSIDAIIAYYLAYLILFVIYVLLYKITASVL